MRDLSIRCIKQGVFWSKNVSEILTLKGGVAMRKTILPLVCIMTLALTMVAAGMKFLRNS